ncbi:MAG: hypothetical protein M1358_12975 [Chloroflexi bacterium]|nr:hypothetical protein [Chloroflexota bacterium]
MPDLFKDIDDDLFQIRADPYRIICHLRHNPGILVLLDGVTKKAMKIPDNRRQRAIHYLKDYYERCLGDESEYEEQASF